MASSLLNVDVARFIPIYSLLDRARSLGPKWRFVPIIRGRTTLYGSQRVESFAMWGGLVRCSGARRLELLHYAHSALLFSVNGVLHHLALGTRHVERLACFYRDVLELPEVTRHLHADGTVRSVWLDLGGGVLMIEQTEEAPRVVQGVGAGPFLIAFAIASTQHERFEHRLLEAGCAIEARSEWTVYARDPDGNRIALSAYPLSSLGFRG